MVHQTIKDVEEYDNLEKVCVIFEEITTYKLTFQWELSKYYN